MDCTDTESAYSMDIDFLPDIRSPKEPSSAHFASAVVVKGFDSQEEVDCTELEPTFPLLRLQLSEAVMLIINYQSFTRLTTRQVSEIICESCKHLGVVSSRY